MLRRNAAKSLLALLALVGTSAWSGAAHGVCPEWHWEAVAVTVTIEPDPGCIDVSLVGALQNCEVPRVEFVNSCSEALEFIETPADTCPGADCPTVQPGGTESFTIDSYDFIDGVPQQYVATLGADQIGMEVSYQTENLSKDEADSGCAIAAKPRGAGAASVLALLGSLLALARRRRRD